MMIVLDASAVLELILQSSKSGEVAHWFGSDRSACAPAIIDLEVVQVLRRYAHSGILEPERARTALQDLMEIRLARYPHTPMLPRIWELKENLTSYDASYVALAEHLGATLLTFDSGV